MAGEDVQVRLAKLARRLEGVSVRYVDDVEGPIDEDGFVLMELYSGGDCVEVLVLTTANFYRCLHKVMAIAMPGSSEFPIQ